MKRSRSKDQGTMYVLKTLEKKKTVKLPLETEASADDHDMKEENILDENKLVASSTLSEEERTAVNQQLKAIARLCSTHDADFRKLVDEHKLGVGEHVNDKIDFLMAVPP